MYRSTIKKITCDPFKNAQKITKKHCAERSIMVSMRRMPEKTNASISGHGNDSEEVRQSPRHLPRLSEQPQPAVLLPSPPPGNNDADEKDDKEMSRSSSMMLVLPACLVLMMTRRAVVLVTM